MKITSLTSDWFKTYETSEGLEYDLNLTFNGPGFYLTKDDTLLIVPITLEGSTRNNIWNRTQPHGTHYRVFVTNARFEHTLYHALDAVAPTRQDTRAQRSS